MDSMELLEKVNTFYTTSWEHLLVFGGIAAAVVGIIVPILLQLYQNRVFKV